MIGNFELDFRAPIADLRVGDKITIEATATVYGIRAALVDITSLGVEPEFTLGEVSVAVTANEAKVKKA